MDYLRENETAQSKREIFEQAATAEETAAVEPRSSGTRIEYIGEKPAGQLDTPWGIYIERDETPLAQYTPSF